MILIIGGACQGKREFVCELSGLQEEEFAKNLADGRTDKPELAWERRFLIGFQGWIYQILETGGKPEEFVKRVLAADPEAVTMDEIGYGIVPAEQSERDYREAVGHAGQLLAGQASQVYRMICGIPQKIKE